MSRRLSVAIAALPEFGDHRIQGKAIVPAAYLLDVMVRAATEAGLLRHAPFALRHASFPRFLPVEEIERCDFALVVDPDEEGTHLALRSIIALPGGIQRTREHAVLSLGETTSSVPKPDDFGVFEGEFVVLAEQLYRELIPFGPRYRNLRGTLRLGRDGAQGIVQSPEPGFDRPSLAGCPYLFDSAMHLACLWGQRYAGVVAYPTGFASRTILAPTTRGQRLCVVSPRDRDPRGLAFDVWLLDENRRMCDAILGLSMVPLARGAAPPAWIVHPDCSRPT